jgi:SAM-dependent methyltransferase
MDPTEFRRSSHAVWEAMAAGWDARHAWFEASARPVTERMLDRLAPRPGETILDLAAGTGVAGFAAAALVEPGGRVIVSDFAEAMVAAAARHAASLGLGNVACRVLDAEHLDVADATVDGVVCRWGYMLMADPAVAFAETRRVLRAGGRMACAVFAGAEQNPWAALPLGVLVERGHVPPPRPEAPGILALADVDRLRRLIVEAGFGEPEIERVAFTLGFDDADGYWQFLTDAAGAIAVLLGQLDGDDRRQVRDEIAARLAPFSTARGVELPAVSLVASAAAGS